MDVQNILSSKAMYEVMLAVALNQGETQDFFQFNS